MKWQLMSFVMVTSCVGNVNGPVDSTEQELDSSTYGFEGSLQGWTGPGAAVSSTRAYAGTHALALKFNGVAGKYEAAVPNPPFTSGTLTAHVWVPWGAGINSVQLFDLENTTWRWHDTWADGSSVAQGHWTTLTLTVPARANPSASIGVEIDARAGWRGTLYIDAVNLPGVVGVGQPPPPPPPPPPADAGVPVVDAGTAMVDAGTPIVDAGTSIIDAGVPVVDAGVPVVDAGTPTPDAGMITAGGTPSLHITGNHILKPDGTIWHGRGANLNDTRSCNACTGQAPNVAEVKRRVDELVDVWKASFIRLDLESYASSDGYRVASNYQSVLYDSAYLADIRDIVQYIGTKPGVYVLVSLWTDPSIDSMGRPTLNASVGTDATWRKIAQVLADQPQAMFGVINEPQSNYDGSGDATVWSAMSGVVKAIRDTEDAASAPYHIITVQGTGGWARRLDYYVTHPITERSGQNIAYEVHVYNPATDFNSLFVNFAPTLPIIIGEFGPMSGAMTTSDCATLMDKAQQLEIPHLAWTFHMRCDPNLLVDSSGGGCGVNMPLTPTAWGSQLKARLATPW
jgi:hypothetical protein